LSMWPPGSSAMPPPAIRPCWYGRKRSSSS
jgi:hypothetical protein